MVDRSGLPMALRIIHQRFNWKWLVSVACPGCTSPLGSAFYGNVHMSDGGGLSPQNRIESAVGRRSFTSTKTPAQRFGP